MTFWVVFVVGGLDLSWQAPKGCPEAAVVRAQLEERLGERAKQLEIDAAIRKQNGRFVLQATIAGVQRTIDNRECAALTRALVMMTMLLAPEPASEPVMAEVKEAPPPEIITEAPPQLSPASTERRLGLGLGVRGGLHAFALPSATFSVVPGVFLETGAARFEIAATYLVQQRVAMAGGGVGAADFAGATASGCYLHPIGAWQIGGCAGGSIGALRVTTSGISEPGAASTPFGWLFAGPTARWHIGSGFSVFASLDASVHVTRPKFAIATQAAATPFYQPAPVAMILQFGADFRWRTRIR